MNKLIGKKISLFILLFIIFLSIFLRFYKLGSNPPSLDWDEASLGYNAYSILKTGADEYGNKLPLSIRSFGDYKPAAYVYSDIPFIALFGLNEVSVRLPSAIMGVLTAIIVYFLVKELFIKWENKLKETIALCSTLFLAISPWHLQFSRAAFEGNIGLFFFLSGALFFLKGLKNKGFFIFSALFFILSLYSYHSFRLVVPLFLVSASLVFWKEVVMSKKYIFIFLAIMVILSLPVYKDFVSPNSTGARLSMVTLFNPSEETLGNSIKEMAYDQKTNNKIGTIFHNRRVIYGLAAVKGYFDHFNLDFLFLHGDGGRQHHAVNVGMLYLWDLPFILIGIFILLNRMDKRIMLLFAWFLISPFPSAISTGTPHPVRAINMIPAFQIFSAVGAIFILQKLIKIRRLAIKLFGIVFICSALALNAVYYFHQYYIHTPIEYGDFWQYGHKQVFQDLSKIENKYKKIVVTYKYDQPYIYYLFYNKIDPKWYQKNWDYNGNGQVDRMKRVIGKYEFRNINWSTDQKLSNTLFIAAPGEVSGGANLIKRINFLDGSVAFEIFGT